MRINARQHQQAAVKPMSGRTYEEIELGDGAKSDLRTQFAALCYRFKNKKLQFCLVTTRGTGRWIVPKGWPMDGETPMDAAATEAYEEAGVKGTIQSRPAGVFSYSKVTSQDELPCLAVVYPLSVEKVMKKWPEQSERTRKWVSRKKAAKMVDDPELGDIIMGFKP